MREFWFGSDDTPLFAVEDGDGPVVVMLHGLMADHRAGLPNRRVSGAVMTDAPHEWVEVRNCAWLHEAELIRSVLASADIEAMIPDQYTLGAQPFYAPMLGGVRVLVRREDLDRAKELLTTLPDGE